MPHFLLRGFRKPQHMLDSAFGALESEVMEAMWKQEKEVSVRDLLAHLKGRIAYTTMMTTMDRLYRKGVFARRKHGRAFLYSPRITREQLRMGLVESVISSLLGGRGSDAEPILSCIVDAVGQQDRELLDDLERLVRRRRGESR
jgi:predicted transcriptional regulator